MDCFEWIVFLYPYLIPFPNSVCVNALHQVEAVPKEVQLPSADQFALHARASSCQRLHQAGGI